MPTNEPSPTRPGRFGRIMHFRRRPRERRWSPHPELVRREVWLRGLDPRHDGVRLVQLSDVHVGFSTPAEHVRKAVSLACSVDPDLVVLTGDYVNWRRREIGMAREQLDGLSGTRVVATLGNHDYYASGGGVAKALESCGYDVLRNDHTTVRLNGAPLHLIGVDDPITGHDDVGAAFRRVPDRGSRVALCHDPEAADEIAHHGAQLILSGHTHGGQIFVRGITDRVARGMGMRYLSGFYPVGGARLYVTPGVGFSGIRVRAGVGTRAEVVEITLRAA